MVVDVVANGNISLSPHYTNHLLERDFLATVMQLELKLVGLEVILR